MLDGLDDIPWDQLTDAYGPATSIPAALRQLASFDPDEREGALDHLYWGLCHQLCTVYEATAPAVPFLIELARCDTVADRDRILVLLGDVTAATSYLAAHGRLDSPGRRAE